MPLIYTHSNGYYGKFCYVYFTMITNKNKKEKALSLFLVGLEGLMTPSTHHYTNNSKNNSSDSNNSNNNDYYNYTNS